MSTPGRGKRRPCKKRVGAVPLVACHQCIPAYHLAMTDGESLILTNARVWTGAASKPWAEAVAVRGRCIAAVGDEAEAAGAIATPMPGKITGVFVEEGQRVKKGEPLLVLEAMKMEHTIKAPAAAVVESLGCAVGDQVEEGATLVVLAAG